MWKASSPCIAIWTEVNSLFALRLPENDSLCYAKHNHFTEDMLHSGTKYEVLHKYFMKSESWELIILQIGNWNEHFYTSPFVNTFIHV